MMNGGGHGSIHPHLPLQFKDFLSNINPLDFRQPRILELPLQAQQNHLLTVFHAGIFSGGFHEVLLQNRRYGLVEGMNQARQSLYA